MLSNSAQYADISQANSASRALRQTQSARTMFDMNIGPEIRRLRKAKGMTLEQLAHEAGTDTGNLSRLERGIQGYKQDLLEKIASALGVKLYQIFAAAEGVSLEQASKNKIEASDEEIREALELKKKFVLVPRYGVTASMGPGAVIHSEQVVDFLSFKNSWVKDDLKASPDCLALIDSRGDSMVPTIKPGDLLLVDRSRIERLTNGIYVLNIDGDLFAKRIERQLDGSIKVISDNPKYTPQTISSEDGKKLSIIGRVVWVGGRL